MSDSSDEVIVRFSSSVHTITTNGKTLKRSCQKLTHLSPNDPKHPVYEKNVIVRAIGNKAVETTEEVDDGKATETTKCSGFDEKDLDKFENEWKTLWDPSIERSLTKH
jgi:hypothetical protein